MNKKSKPSITNEVDLLKLCAAACELSYVKEGWVQFAEFKQNLSNCLENFTLTPFYKDGGHHSSSTDSLGGYIISSEYFVVVAFRGSEKGLAYWREWRHDLNSHPRCLHIGQMRLPVLVHAGMATEYARSRDDCVRKLCSPALNLQGKKVIFTGHSLGTICHLAALELVQGVSAPPSSPTLGGASPQDGFTTRVDPHDVAVVTFGAPKLFSRVTCGSQVFRCLTRRNARRARSSSTPDVGAVVDQGEGGDGEGRRSIARVEGSVGVRAGAGVGGGQASPSLSPGLLQPLDVWRACGSPLAVRVRFARDPVPYYPCLRR